MNNKSHKMITRSQSKKNKENTIIYPTETIIDKDTWDFDRRIDFCYCCYCYVIYYKNEHDCNNKILPEVYRR